MDNSVDSGYDYSEIDDLVQKKMACICMKNHLAILNYEELKSVYCSINEEDGIDYYKLFLDVFELLLIDYCAFFILLPSAYKKACKIFFEKRFDYRDKETFDKINTIIGKINIFDSMSNELKQLYLSKQLLLNEMIRELKFKNLDEEVEHIIDDAIMVKFLIGEGTLTGFSLDKSLGSIKYLINYIPEMFIYYDDVQNRVLEYMERCNNESNIFQHKSKRMIRNIKNYINYLNSEGEEHEKE